MDVMSVYGRYPKDSPISDRVAPVDRVCRPFAARCRTGSDVTGNGQPQVTPLSSLTLVGRPLDPGGLKRPGRLIVCRSAGSGSGGFRHVVGVFSPCWASRLAHVRLMRLMMSGWTPDVKSNALVLS